MSKSYILEDLVKVARRENNNKRGYLYVDPLQGKHIPVHPGESLELFGQLAHILEEKYPGERLLLIGFAETATAIGAAIAEGASNVKYYLHTTRENVEGAQYLSFTESHSHATEQRLVVNGLKEAVEDTDRIVFAEDELTTGRTIEKLINVIRDHYPEKHLKFGIISILNSMTQERLAYMGGQGISCDYVLGIPFQYRADESEMAHCEPLLKECSYLETDGIVQIAAGNCWNGRIVSSTEGMKEKLRAFTRKVRNQLKIQGDEKNILVLGTEECMYPGLVIARQIEEQCPDSDVRFHATTRSPIEISKDEGYPLYSRNPLDSFYQEDRRTFVYNLKKYDHVIIVTDAPESSHGALRSLAGALAQYQNHHITLVRWGDHL